MGAIRRRSGRAGTLASGYYRAGLQLATASADCLTATRPCICRADGIADAHTSLLNNRRSRARDGRVFGQSAHRRKRDGRSRPFVAYREYARLSLSRSSACEVDLRTDQECQRQQNKTPCGHRGDSSTSKGALAIHATHAWSTQAVIRYARAFIVCLITGTEDETAIDGRRTSTHGCASFGFEITGLYAVTEDAVIAQVRVHTPVILLIAGIVDDHTIWDDHWRTSTQGYAHAGCRITAIDGAEQTVFAVRIGETSTGTCGHFHIRETKHDPKDR